MARTVRIRVKLHGETKRGVPGLVGDHVDADVPAGSSVAEMLGHIGVDRSEVWLSAVNKVVVQPDHILAEGDAVEVFAPVSGGSGS